MNFDIGQTHRLLVAHRAHGPDIPRGVSRENAGALCPAAQPAQRIQAAIDGRRSPAGRDHVLAGRVVSSYSSEAFDGEKGCPGRSDATPGSDAGHNGSHAASPARGRHAPGWPRKGVIQPGSAAMASAACIARKVIPRVSTLIYCVQEIPVYYPIIASHCALHAMIARNKQPLRIVTRLNILS